MSLDIRMKLDPVRSLAFGAIRDAAGAFIGIGTSLDNPARLILIQNLTDQTLMFSFDGIDDHFPLVRKSGLFEDIAANKTISTGFFLAEGERLYVRYIDVAPTVGAVYLTTFYGVS